MKRKLKILILASHLGGGGTERRTVHILKHINRDIFEPILCVWEKRGVYVKDIPRQTKVYAVKKRYKVFTLLNMCKVINKEKPDIIFGNMWRINATAIVALKMMFFKRKRKAKLIIGVVTNPSYLKRQRPIRFLYSFADLFVANSYGIREYLVSSWKIPKERIRVIHNGVDIKNIDKLSFEKANHIWIKNNYNLIISVGRLSEPKGHPYLIDALKIANKKNPIYLIIVGEGEEEERLKKMAKKIGINNRVDFIGFKKNPFKYIAKTNLFILASLWEGFPSVLLEAMACRTPVVSTNAPYGPSEIIEDGVNGYLVPVADSTQLAKKILYVLENLDKQDNVIRKARQTVEKKFTFDTMLKNYEKLFCSICADTIHKL